MPVEISLFLDKPFVGRQKVRTRGSFTSTDDVKAVIEGFKSICFACPLAADCESRPRMGAGKTVFTDGKKAGDPQCQLLQRTIILR
jgi:hypothetical protein